MKSRTYFFNWTVFRKDLSRFAPGWVIYVLFLVLGVSTLTAQGEPLAVALALNEWLPAMSYVNCLYAGMVVMFLAGDLYISRMCYALHAMPLRREGWFFSHSAAGLAMCLVPNTLAALALMPALQGYWHHALIAWLVCLLQYLSFFGAAVFASMLAGNRFAMVLFYALINGFSMIFMGIAQMFYQPLMYGLQLRQGTFRQFCPFLQLASSPYLTFSQEEGSAVYLGAANGNWIYLLVCAGAGLLLFALSLFLYRRRNLESAGDFIAIRWMAPVFLAVYTLGMIAVLYTFVGSFLPKATYILLIAGLVLGFYSGQMLLSKSVKVFRLRVFLGFAAMTAIFACALAFLWLDPTGVVSYVPKAQQIKSVTISTSSMLYLPELREEAPQLTLSGEEEIQQIVDIHKALLEKQQTDSQETDFTLFLEYTMKDGRTIQRNYPVRLDTPQGERLVQYFSSWECVFPTKNWSHFVSCVTAIQNGTGEPIPQAYLGQVLSSLLMDCQEGHMAQTWSLYDFAPAAEQLTLTYDTGNGEEQLTLRIYEFSTHTLQILHHIAGLQGENP